MNTRRWTTLSSVRLLERWWMTLRQDHVRLPSGAEMEEYHVLEYPDWSCVIALTPDGEIVLVEQYRYGIDRLCLELPAGAIDEGETPLQAARRELREEAGYVAEDWRSLGRLAVEPGRHTNWGHLFIALDVRWEGPPALDLTEDLHVVTHRAESLPGLIDEGHLVHGVHVAAVLRAMHEGLLPGRS